MSGRPLHPFNYATYPRALNRALRRGLLTRDDYVILVSLYARANRVAWTVTTTLEQIAEAIDWKRSIDWLYRRLADLKRRRWIAFQAEPGKKHPSYTIRLLYEADESPLTSSSDPSEETPSTQSLNDAGLGSGDARMGPSTELPGPSTEDGGNPLPEPLSERGHGDGLRASRDVLEKTTPLIEEKVLCERLDKTAALGEAAMDDSRFLAALNEKREADAQGFPLPGDHDFVERLLARRRVLTQDELLERLRIHRLTAPATEGTLDGALAGELAELLIEGVLIDRDAASPTRPTTPTSGVPARPAERRGRRRASSAGTAAPPTRQPRRGWPRRCLSLVLRKPRAREASGDSASGRCEGGGCAARRACVVAACSGSTGRGAARATRAIREVRSGRPRAVDRDREAWAEVTPADAESVGEAARSARQSGFAGPCPEPSPGLTGRRTRKSRGRPVAARTLAIRDAILRAAGRVTTR